MKIFSTLVTGVFAAALTLTPAAAQETVKQDVKEAGHDVKDAAKDTGRATKTAGKKVYHGTKKGVHKILDAVAAVGDERRKRVPTAKLNQVVRDAFRMHPPPSYRSNTMKCYYATQTGTAPPEIVLFVNDPRLLHFSYERYLENCLRDAFDFSGTPIRLVFRPRVQQDRTEAEELIVSNADASDAP